MKSVRQMSHSVRNLLLSIRDLLVSAGPLAFLGVALVIGAYWWLKPTPPKSVILATGPGQSAYEEFGKRYQDALAAEGIKVTLTHSEGSAANLQLLRDGKVDLAFVQGGTAELRPEDRDDLISLGSLFVEPIWLFYRADSAKRLTRRDRLDGLHQLRGMKVNVGSPGSGLPRLMEKLLDANHIGTDELTLTQEHQTPATVAFLNGELDAIVFASAPESLMVQMLLQTPGIQLMSFAQNEAYSRRFPFLTPVTLPRGVVDLARNIPSRDIRLVASTTSLLAREDTHPALLTLFAQNALRIHGSAGWFNRAREFPSTLHAELPIAKEADRAINEPTPVMQRYLPFWIANLIERMWLILGILIAFMLPLSRIVPPLYQFRVRSRVFRWYGKLREIEDEFELGESDSAQLLEQLDRIESQVEKISVPLSYADELYALRNHIQMVRRKLNRAPGTVQGTASPTDTKAAAPT